MPLHSYLFTISKSCFYATLDYISISKFALLESTTNEKFYQALVKVVSVPSFILKVIADTYCFPFHWRPSLSRFVFNHLILRSQANSLHEQDMDRKLAQQGIHINWEHRFSNHDQDWFLINKENEDPILLYWEEREGRAEMDSNPFVRSSLVILIQCLIRQFSLSSLS